MEDERAWDTFYSETSVTKWPLGIFWGEFLPSISNKNVRIISKENLLTDLAFQNIFSILKKLRV